MNHNRRSIRQQRMRALFQRDIRIFQSRLRLSICTHGEVLHVTSVMAVWAIEPVLFAFWIEMSARGFEVRPFALGRLMKVDSVLPRRKVVHVHFECDTRSL